MRQAFFTTAMKKYAFKTFHKKLLADINTPVSIYLRLRDKFPNSILLESSDYHGNENSFSFICCHPIASIRVEDGMLHESYPDGSHRQTSLEEVNLSLKIKEFSDCFEPDPSCNFSFINNGLFGYTTYDSVQYFDDITFTQDIGEDRKIPELYYSIYRFVIAINHFRNEMYLFDHQCNGEGEKDEIEMVEYQIRNKDYPVYKFSSTGEEASNFTDEEFLESLDKVKAHNHRGDVFQLVLSRRFSKKFTGDEFNVYRSLRSINPSPYLFYFDYGNFKIFGSSPEAQIVIKSGKAIIHPIAGTFRRTGNDQEDERLAERLKNDPKENSEHVMLVDLARNDLSRNCSNVVVESFREIQFYSHVIHLVSRVSGDILEGMPTMKIVADTFPAGTLSGAPKYRAMELIDEYERGKRGYYGGCIGFIGFNGYFNHAIMIRSFLSKDNTLHYQAGAGIVSDSVVENELHEVNNKLMALKTAITMAEEIV
jgi:anthranilate synthase component I